MAANLPRAVSDVIMHTKTDTQEEVVVLPVTRYDNVMNSPHVIETAEAHPGAPFHLFITGEEEMTSSEIRKFGNGIM